MNARCLHGLVSADFFVMMQGNSLDLGTYKFLFWFKQPLDLNEI